MPPSRVSQAPSRIMSYHYDVYGGRWMQTIESSSIEDCSSMVNSAGHLHEGTEALYTISTSKLYDERNVDLQPLMPRWEIQSQMTSESMSNMSDGFEAERIASMTDLVDNTGSIPHEFIAIHPMTVTFVITKAFEWLLIWFNTKYFVSFPDIPCAYCGVLSLGRTICWIEACKVAQDGHISD